MSDEEWKNNYNGNPRNQNSGSWDGNTERRHRHHHSSRRRWLMIQWIIIFLEAICIAALLVWANLLDADKAELLKEEKQLSQQIADGAAALESLQGEYNKLKDDQAKSCLSSLIPLKFDEVVEINKNYVKSGIFFWVGTKEKKSIEFKFILENKNKSPIVPMLEVVFFNGAGQQLGISKIGYNKDGTLGHDVLEPGEIRSYTSVFEINREDKPESFMVKIKND